MAAEITTPELPIEPLDSEPSPKPKHPHALWLVIFLFILLPVIAIAGYWFQMGSFQPLIDIVYPLITPTVALSPTPKNPTPRPTTANIETTGITWNQNPKKIAALTLFKPEPSPSENTYMNEGSEFFEVGTKADGTKIINAYVIVNGPGGKQFFRVVKSKQGNLTLLIPARDADWIRENLSRDLLPGIEISTNTLPGIEPPETLTVNNNQYQKAYYTGIRFNELVAPEKIADTSFGPMYKTIANLDSQSSVKARKLYLKIPDDTMVPYSLMNPFITDDKAVQISWQNDGFKDVSFTQNVAAGCGINLADTTPVVVHLSDEKQVVGKMSNDTPVYSVSNVNDSLLNELYNQYKLGREYPDAPPILSKEEFAAKPNHVIWQDPLGDWQLFVNQAYAPMVECGKPVVYLYPMSSTPVHVAVDAAVRISDPVYPAGGWDVIAHPSGELEYQGATYPNLFWEGQGNGYYPDYRTRGVVVAKTNLHSTLKTQLSQLGLNAIESQDFLNFWLAKFPDKPYYRLTWLGTTDMERLAPLTVEPKPDTLIRIFLEFEGLNQPVTLTPQVLSAPTRTGFTVVEWGGLLTTHSN